MSRSRDDGRSSEWKGYSPGDWDEVEQKALRELSGVPALCISEGDFVEFSVK